MIKVKNLYVKVVDDDGHSYLINKDVIEAFQQTVDALYDMVYKEDIDTYYNEYEDLLDYYGAINVEGEEYYIVRKEDVLKGDL